MKLMSKKASLVLLLIMSLTRCTNIQEPTNLKTAKSYFSELDSLCSVDNGKLLGINLYGATMLVDPQSRLIVANQSDNNKCLKEKDGVYIGKLPLNYNISNTSFDWNGKKWTMVMWNALSSTDKYSRDQLLIHESWHRIQNEIGIKPLMSENTHLDGLQGAILLKLELSSLMKALQTEEILQKKKCLSNALTIRKYRQLLFPNNTENDFERHEGMAEYTGYKLCGLSDSIITKVVSKKLELSMDKDGLANSFAYLTGPAYGILFNNFQNNWIREILQGKRLPEIGLEIEGINIPSDSAKLKSTISMIISEYHAETLVKSETEKFKQQNKLIAYYKQKLINGNQLIIRNNNLNFSYNPQEKLIPIDSLGVVYKTMRITGEWGFIEVNNGILRTNDWKAFVVSAPTSANAGTIEESDYRLVLNNRWCVYKVKDGKYTLKKN